MNAAYDEPGSLSLGPDYRRLWSAAAASNLALLWVRRSLTDEAIDATEAAAAAEAAEASEVVAGPYTSVEP